MSLPEPDSAHAPREQMLRYLGGESDAASDARLNAMLASDPAWRAEFAELLLLEVQLREIGRELESAQNFVPLPRTRKSLNWRTSRSLAVLAASVALGMGLGVWFFTPTMGEPVLAEVTGGVRLERIGQSPAAANVGTRLLPGDVLVTETNAAAALTFGTEPTRLDLGAVTELRLVSLKSGKRFDLRAGRLEADVARQRPFAPLVVATPSAEAVVLGTRFTLTSATNRTRLDVAEGKVRLLDTTGTNAGHAVKVGAGQYAIVAAATELAALPATGGLLREQWFGLPKETLDMLPFNLSFPGKPDGSSRLPLFEIVETRTNSCATRLRGYLHPSVSGNYTLWMASAKPAYLFLSRSDSPQAMQAELSAGGQAFREWDYVKRPGDGGRQRTLPIPLTAGRRYYVEVVATAPAGEAHLSVAWQPPGGARETIRGEFLSPFQPTQ